MQGALSLRYPPKVQGQKPYPLGLARLARLHVNWHCSAPPLCQRSTYPSHVHFEFCMLKSSLKSVPASRIIAGILVGIAALLFFFGNVMIIMRAGILTTPVYAGDEYGHWANARFFASGLAREQFDPFLPSLHSYLYFFITRWLTLSPEGPAAMRLLNYLFIGITAALVWGLARALVSRPLALLASGLVFSLGSTTWAAAVMPETMYTCIIVGVAVFMVRVWSPDRSPDSFVAGAMIGALLLA